MQPPAAAIAKVKDYFSSPETWLEGRTGLDAVDKISNVEFEIARILDDDAGEEGRRFRETAEYVEGMDKLKTMKQQCEATASTGAAPPAAAGAAPQPAAAATNAESPLGPHGALLGLISNDVLADERNFTVLLTGLRSEASKGEYEAAWKAAARLGSHYTRGANK